MGQKQSVFSEQELKDYEELTYFTKREVQYGYERFCSLAPELFTAGRCPDLPVGTILSIPELKVNPFSDRIVKFFCSEEGFMSFEDFLDMMSVFSENAPRSVKTEYAFRIYDFNEDDVVTADDIQVLISRIKEEQEFTQSDYEEVIERVLLEADTDEDGSLTFTEFENMITKSVEFMNTFRIRL